MPRKAEYDTSRELGLCVNCNEQALPGKSRCAKHAAERREAYRAKPVGVRRACSYCGELGHNSAGCAAMATDIAQIDADIAERAKTLDPSKNPFEWEVRKEKRDQIDGVLVQITKAKTLRQAIGLVKKVRGML
jgi:hypothetical protein